MTSLHLTVRAATLTDVEAIWRIYRATNPEGKNLNDQYWDNTIQHGDQQGFRRIVDCRGGGTRAD